MSIIRKTPISTLFPYTTLFRSFRQIKRLVARSKNFYTVFFQFLRQLQCGLSAQLNDHTFRLFMENYFINMFPKRSQEHTSELQSRLHLVCRLLLEKQKELITKN